MRVVSVRQGPASRHVRLVGGNLHRCSAWRFKVVKTCADRIRSHAEGRRGRNTEETWDARSGKVVT
jgi:hypothetical protein